MSGTMRSIPGAVLAYLWRSIVALPSPEPQARFSGMGQANSNSRRVCASGSRLLVRSNKLSLRQDVPSHSLFQLRFRWLSQVRENRVQRIQLVKVAVPTDRWTRTPVTNSFPVVPSFLRAHGQCL